MSLLHHEFHPGSNDKYELSFSAWGEGILCEDALLDIQKPDKAIEIPPLSEKHLSRRTGPARDRT